MAPLRSAILQVLQWANGALDAMGPADASISVPELSSTACACACLTSLGMATAGGAARAMPWMVQMELGGDEH